MDNPLLIQPILHPLNATVQVPGSKSLTNRVLLLAALANGKSRLSNALFSDDSRFFAGALRDLGFDLEINEPDAEICVSGTGGVIPRSSANLFIGNAGTAARFLSAFLTLGRGEYVLDGDARMRERPIGDLVSALRGLGANLETAPNQCPPVRVHANGLPGGATSVAGNISSQFLSALLMVAPYARLPVEIQITTELNSKPYIDLTIAVMKAFGISIDQEDYHHFCIQPGMYQARKDYWIEPDASAASYFFAAPAACGGTVTVRGLTRNALQGDIRFLEILERMGCEVTAHDDGLQVRGPEQLRGVDVDMRDISDTAQTLAAIAPFASTPTRIRGIASSRLKETDRVSAVCTELRRLGVQVEEYPDGLEIQPCASFRPAIVQTYNDHRMAMAFSLIGLRIPGVSIADPGCVSKTFTNYFQVLQTLREP